MAFSDAEIAEEFADATDADISEYSYAHVKDGSRGLTIAGRTGAHNPKAQAEYQKRRRETAKVLGWPSGKIRSQREWAKRKLCACGCGKLTNGSGRYLHNHFWGSPESRAVKAILAVLQTGWSTPGPSGGQLKKLRSRAGK